MAKKGTRFICKSSSVQSQKAHMTMYTAGEVQTTISTDKIHLQINRLETSSLTEGI